MLSEMLDLPTVKQRALPITLEQYHALGREGLISEKVELLEGVIVEKMPKSPLDIFLVLALLEWLQKAVTGDFHVRSEAPITCRGSEPEPDLSVVRGSRQDYLQALPQGAELVIEVALSSVEIDRRKTPIYAESGVREYWIVLPESRQIEVHTKLAQPRYSVQRTFADGQTAFSEVLPAFRVELSALFPR